MIDHTTPYTPPMQHPDDPAHQALIQRFWRVDPKYLAARLATQSGSHGELSDRVSEDRTAA